MIKVNELDKQDYFNLVYENHQDHIFKFWDSLGEGERDCLLTQISKIDFKLMDKLIKKAKVEKQSSVFYNNLAPAKVVDLKEREARDQDILSIGEDALQMGEVAAFLVAGGQGSRLGFDGPKGIYPVTPVKKKSLFQVYTEKLLALSKRYGKEIPWYIMASDTNLEYTKSFFVQNNYFGYASDNMKFFIQDMLPAIDKNGKFILSESAKIFESPNGHGGSIKALWDSGAIQDMKDRGIKYIFYFQVDNVLTAICDPYFLGYHIYHESEMSNKVVRKAYPEEKMGIICEIDNKIGVVEYSDLSEEDMFAKNPDGTLKYWAGSVATHVLNVDFIERENLGGFHLPFHIAEKKVPYIDTNQQLIVPDDKNGVKFETFVFDALFDAKKTLTLEVERRLEFSALKNREGFDSPETVRKDLLRVYAKFLKEGGFQIDTDQEGIPNLSIELSPLFALNARDIKEKKNQVPSIIDGLYLE